ncbi:hypothetical protein AB0M12_37850 [Nocardia vinacea]|uniref:hypothetical protein n=1 Tax=Nocardia vinacea TaxID=96468 RepID=UPI0034259BDA
MATNKTAPIRRPGGTGYHRLKHAACGYAIGMVVHGGDHAFRGLTGDTHHATWPGSVQLVMATLTLVISAFTVVLAFSGHRYASAAAMVIGFGSAAVFLLIHMLPGWGAFNDSFVSAPSGSRITPFSWVTAVVGISASVALGLAGVRARHR